MICSCPPPRGAPPPPPPPRPPPPPPPPPPHHARAGLPELQQRLHCRFHLPLVRLQRLPHHPRVDVREHVLQRAQGLAQRARGGRHARPLGPPAPPRPAP